MCGCAVHKLPVRSFRGCCTKPYRGRFKPIRNVHWFTTHTSQHRETRICAARNKLEGESLKAPPISAGSERNGTVGGIIITEKRGRSLRAGSNLHLMQAACGLL